jgi:hypothetical protein
MKKLLLVALSVTVGSFVFAGVARAHHGDANRYNEEVTTISGAVVELQMINPHSIIVMDVDEGGKKVRWQAELGGPQQLMRQFGWTKSTIKPGDKISITGRRAKSGAPYMNLTERANIVNADTGKELFRTANYGQPAGAAEAPAPAGRGSAPNNQ